MRDQFYETWIDADLRIAVEYGGRPVDDYAVMLQARVSGEWRTIFLTDNRHGTHHCHRYTGETKLEAEPFFDGPDNHAIAHGVKFLYENADEIVSDWKNRSEIGDA